MSNRKTGGSQGLLLCKAGSQLTIKKIANCFLQCPELWDMKPVVYRDLNEKARKWTVIRQFLNFQGLLQVVGYLLLSVKYIFVDGDNSAWLRRCS